VAGCAVGPDYKPPATTAPTAWVGTQDKPDPAQKSFVAPSPVTSVDWWNNFNDPELAKLVKEGAAENFTVLQAQAVIQESRANVNVVGSGLWPAVNGTGAYNYGAVGNAPAGGNFQAGANGLWNVDVFGGIRRQVEAAEAQMEVSIEDKRDALVTLETEIGSTYMDLRSAQKQIDIAQTNLDIQNHSLKITQQRYSGGFESLLDVKNAEAQADTTRAGIPSLETEERQDIYSLSVLVGQDPGALMAELTPPAPLPKPPEQIQVGLPSDLLRRRPDIRGAEAQFHAANANIGVAIADLFPKFSLTGSLNFNSGSFSQLFTWANSSWTVGPSVNWQIFAAGQVIANIHLQEATQIAAFYAYKSTVLTAFQQVEASMIAYTKEQVRQKALEDAVAANQKATDLSNVLYQQGETEFLNVLTAEAALYSTQQQLAISKQAEVTDLITLYEALGGGWSPFPEQDAIPVGFSVFPYGTAPKAHGNPHAS
jgi:outer membrane protein, multidrug efflux system